MRWVILFAVGACVPVEDEPPAPIDGDLALYRVEAGESIGFVAEKLHFPGGYRALKRALGKHSDELRADEGLAIPIGYTRALGLDPYTDLGLVPYEPPLADEPVVPCRTVEDHGSCVDLGDRVLCIEETAPRATSGDPEVEAELDCQFEVDGATECPRMPGRELVSYRGAQRRVVSPLPSGGRFHRGDHELEVHRIDLDGDRLDEVIAVVPLDVYNRMGIDTRRVFVFDGRSERFTQLDVDQWGDGSIIANQRATCDLLVTSWEDGELDPRLPSGFYFVGRPYEYERGELLPRGDRRVRRLRETIFHIDQAVEDRYSPALPAHWLTEPGTSRWSELPVRGDFRSGRVVAIETRPGTGVVLDIAFSDGSTERLDPAVEGTYHLRELGWGPTSTRFAQLYMPSEPQRWVGAAVLVDRPPPMTAEDGDAYYFDSGREVWIAP